MSGTAAPPLLDAAATPNPATTYANGANYVPNTNSSYFTPEKVKVEPKLEPNYTSPYTTPTTTPTTMPPRYSPPSSSSSGKKRSSPIIVDGDGDGDNDEYTPKATLNGNYTPKATVRDVRSSLTPQKVEELEKFLFGTFGHCLHVNLTVQWHVN